MAVPGTTGLCTDCWNSDVDHGQLGGLNKIKMPDSNVSWDSREDVHAKMLAASGYTIVPDSILSTLLQQIQELCPATGELSCMYFQQVLASVLTPGLRLCTEQVPQLIDALGPNSCPRVYAVSYSCMLCPWECPEDGPAREAFYKNNNMPWSTTQFSGVLKQHFLKEFIGASADASDARPVIVCTCGECPKEQRQARK